MKVKKLFMKEKLILCVEGSPASRSVLREEERERRMTATSGRRCSELYSRQNRPGLFAKMLLTLPIWHSRGRRLVWRARATSCGHLLFRLVPLERRTGETESGLLPTPAASDARAASRKRYPGSP